MLIDKNFKKIEFIREIHKRNFELIKKHNLKVGNELSLIKDFEGFKKGEIFKIGLINSFYGWVCFKETERLPQDVEGILKILKKVGE